MRQMVLIQALESLQCFRGRESNSMCVRRDMCLDQASKHTVICILVCVRWRNLLITCMQVHTCINMLDFNAKS